MPGARVIYQNWIVDIGRDPGPGFELPVNLPGTDTDLIRRAAVGEAVDRAIALLSEAEREVIRRHHFMGESFRSLAEETGKAEFKLVALHSRATKKLRRLLAPFMKQAFGADSPVRNTCPICDSPFRSEIDILIRQRDSTRTWRPVMTTIRRRYGIVIRAPQVILSHVKYHF